MFKIDMTSLKLTSKCLIYRSIAQAVKLYKSIAQAVKLYKSIAQAVKLYRSIAQAVKMFKIDMTLNAKMQNS